MELIGNEKKIQALFRELKLADARVAPEFNRVWDAQASRPGTSRVFKFSFAVAAALFVIALSSLVLWSQKRRGSQLSNPIVAAGPATIGSTPAMPLAAQPTTPGMAGRPDRVRSNRADRKAVARRHPNLTARNAATQEAVAISSWQSPTAMLLQSPVDNVLASLPQLDRSLKELKTFLPDTPQ